MNNQRSIKFWRAGIFGWVSFLLGVLLLQVPVAKTATPQIIYQDTLAAGWQNWSWSSTVNFNANTPVQQGTRSVAVTYTSAWAGFYLRAGSPVDVTGFDTLQFWIHGGSTGGQRLGVAQADGSLTYAVQAIANTWTKVQVPLSALGASGTVDGFWWVDQSGGAQATFFIDDIQLVSSTTSTSTGTAVAADIIYGDSLINTWQNWSWNTTLNFSNNTPVQQGSRSLSVQYTAGWAALYLRALNPYDITPYDTLSFWIHGGSTGGQQLAVLYADGTRSVALTATANTWQQVQIPLTSLDATSSINGLWFMDQTGGAQPTFYLDQIQFVKLSLPTPTPSPTTIGSSIQLTVDLNQPTYPIQPEIYGINFGDAAMLSPLGIGTRRWGGNAVSRYNWQADISNRASDWYYANIGDNDPANNSSDVFIDETLTNDAQMLLTVPLMGWVSKNSPDFTCGFSVAKYGAQQGSDPWHPDCGNGVRTNGNNITGNDPTDTSIAVGTLFVQDWVQHLVDTFGDANSGGVKFYAMDNEPMLWHHTHRDVHPTYTSYDEIRNLTYDYAPAIKAVDPNAQILGPVVWGWTAYFYSAKDSQAGGSWWNNPVDRNAHGGTPFLPWYLQQMAAYEQQHGERILDYLDIHYYPQASNVALSTAGSATTQALRLRSTRDLWDSSYTAESWINEPVMLIPRMHDWIDQNYPGTKLAITEYNWGGLESINGAVTQAEVLGVFGREQVDLATLWDPKGMNDPWAFSFRMYRNYDGKGAQFGDQSTAASSSNDNLVSIFAAQDGSGTLTVMLVNKNTSAHPISLNVLGDTPSSATGYRYSDQNLAAIQTLGTFSFSNGTLSTTLPAQSITLLEIVAEPMATATATTTPTATATTTATTAATSTNTPTATATPLPSRLNITKALNRSLVNIGDAVTYTLTISNTGGIDLHNVTVTDVLDSRLDFLFGSNPRGTVTASGQTVTADLGTLAVGESVQVIVVAEVNATTVVGDSIPNTATADSDETPPTPSNEVVITTIPNQLPNTGIAGQAILALLAVLTAGTIALTYPRWRKKATR